MNEALVPLIAKKNGLETQAQIISYLKENNYTIRAPSHRTARGPQKNYKMDLAQFSNPRTSPYTHNDFDSTLELVNLAYGYRDVQGNILRTANILPVEMPDGTIKRRVSLRSVGTSTNGRMYWMM